jgi:ankyrin repeat protein
MARIIRVASVISGIFLGVAMCLAANTPAYATPFDDCSKGDLAKQNTCLACRAIYQKNDQQLRQLLSSPYVNIDDPQACGRPLLWASAEYNNASAMSILISAGASVNLRVPQPMPTSPNLEALIYLIDYDNTVSMDRDYIYAQFLNAGLDPNAIARGTGGAWSVAPSILEAQFEMCGNNGNYNRNNIARALINNGANANYIAPHGISLLHWVAFLAGKPCVVNILNALQLQFKRSDLIAANTYFDVDGFSPIDYSMTLARQIDNGRCQRVKQNESINQYSIAEYLSTMDTEFLAEFNQKKQGPFYQLTNCALARETFIGH